MYRILFTLLILLANTLWASASPVQLWSERHRTEWNWVNYRLTLKNISNSPLVNPVIRYFAENPRIQYCKANPNDNGCSGMQYGLFDVDSSLRAYVDTYTNVTSVIPMLSYDSEYTIVSFKILGSIPAHVAVEIHFRLIKYNGAAWDCSHDYSHQKNAAIQEENYKMVVYDKDGNLLWGSDPIALSHDSTNVYWHDRSSTEVVSQYDGSDSAKVFNGRFWLLKGSPLSFEERMSLDSMGAKLLETTRYQNKGLHLLKAFVPISKKSLNKALSNFYNAFVVDDTTRLSLKISPKDIYEESYSCDANDSCMTIVSERSAIDLVVECWPDLPMESCKNVVLICGGDNAYIDRSVILAKVHRDSIQCLEKHRDVRYVYVKRKAELTNYLGRQAINLANLQNDSSWQQAMQAPQVTIDWLKGVDYTGEGITVGVYDSGIDFRHPDLNEVDSLGNEVPRKAMGYDDLRTVGNRGIRLDTFDVHNPGYHGTHVAGIIGGNGRMSETVENAIPYQYRGVAPKVLFHSGYNWAYNQKGNIVNHSHEWTENVVIGKDTIGSSFSYYGVKNSELDRNIFFDWKLPSEHGDFVTKTVVFSAGNTATYLGSTGHGYHSIRVHSKNAIVVGAFNYSSNLRTYFSSMGPTWDGRIKPDVMAPGDGIPDSSNSKEQGVESCAPYGWLNLNKYYRVQTGTSQAAPFVSGITALMYQKFQKTTSLPLDVYFMRNSTAKALLIHSAVDMLDAAVGPNYEISATDHTPDFLSESPYTLGPDYSTGWGRVDAKGALDLMDGYDAESKNFDKFREFNMYGGVQKRWTINVDESRPRLRVTLAWDDAPGDPNVNNYMQPKLVNDLDLYLISPSGKIYYPWLLDTLPTQNINDKGENVGDERITARKWGYERISITDARKPAYTCSSLDNLPLDSCFDRRNNVEVVDVDNPPLGVWQVVVKGYQVWVGNSSDRRAQIASIVSDLKLNEPTDNGKHPYLPNMQTSEIIPLGDYLEHYVTFGPETFLGAGDHIYLYDGRNRLIGNYMGNELAGKRILVKTRFLKIILDSDNDDSQGYGYSISKIEHVPYGILQVLFPPYKKKGD
ncbi:S8 family serine peptidase [Fibrobacter sp.]|uniref:S8 family serine peptidase n=1 Tax=Fibrobacter sp. TaxID=35828 RepID=UPI0025BDC83A|nr:S8 family serine peptidase [Fibrobacter sp.]MBR3070975.1 S8 family serine peptidase [Fibrobacter sp.]